MALVVQYHGLTKDFFPKNPWFDRVILLSGEKGGQVDKIQLIVLQEIVETVRTNSRSCSFQSTVDMSMNTGYRSYEFCYTCAVDKTNIKRVIDGTKNIIIRDYFSKMGISLD